VLVTDGDGYRLAEHPPLAADRVSLPETLAAQVERAAASARYTWAAADLTSVAAWGDPAPAGDLAERLLVAPGEVPGLLAYAVSDHLVQRVGEGIAALPRRQQPQPVSVPVVVPSRSEHPATIPGAPPRAGVVGGSGDVIVWRAGEPVVLGRVPDQYRYRAHETPVGIAVATSGGPGMLVRWDGTTERLPADLGTHPVRSADGRFLAGVEHHVGRRSWDRPHLLDVTTGEVTSLPRTDELTRRALAVIDGALCYSDGFHAGSRTFRWRPGTDPEPLEPGLWQIDPLSGAALERGPDGVFHHRPDGTRTPVPADRQYELAPGGELLYAFQYAPPSVWLLDDGEPEEHPLPEGCDLSTAIPSAPFWETTATLVFTHGRGGTSRLVRWDVRSGRFEHFDLPAVAGYRPFAVQPVY
jgi:hypothetical protein